MKVTSTVDDRDQGMEAVRRRLGSRADHVDIGIHSDADQLLIKIAAAHEFGATINHPGGTAYGYQTPDDAKHHRIKFLKGKQGFRVLGVTKPHVIVIPMRSYIRSTMDQHAEAYQAMAERLVSKVIDGSMSKFEALAIMGQKIESDMKATIVNMKAPPLKEATIRRKGSSALLQDKGHLKTSIRYVVKDKDDKTGGEATKK